MIVIYNNFYSHFVFQEAAATLREIINNDSREQLSIKLENDIRRGEVVIGNHHLFAKVYLFT